MEKRSLALPALWLFGIYALYGCVLTPLLHYISVDIVLRQTVWFDILDLLSSHAEIYGAALLYGFLAGAVYRYGVKNCVLLYLLSGGALLFKYVCAVGAICVADRAIDLTGSLWEYLLAFLLECLLAVLVVFLAHRLISPALARYRARREAAAVLGRDLGEGDGCLPYDGLFRWRNPLQRTLFLGMIILAAVRVIAFTVDYLYGGGLSAVDILVMFLYWLILILLPAFFGYFIARRCAEAIGKPPADDSETGQKT